MPIFSGSIFTEEIRGACCGSSVHAPRISSVKIDPEKIGMVIGKGGETIRSLEADYDVQIDIEADGNVLIYSTAGDLIVSPPLPITIPIFSGSILTEEMRGACPASSLRGSGIASSILSRM